MEDHHTVLALELELELELYIIIFFVYIQHYYYCTHFVCTPGCKQNNEWTGRPTYYDKANRHFLYDDDVYVWLTD
jgi:hypothetical protein